jgi:enamine deaminase RidA (YjgF/YER057c/UK114 family)
MSAALDEMVSERSRWGFWRCPQRFNKSFRVEMQKAADEWLMERNEYRAVLNAAGASVEDIVRLTWYVIDKREYLARQAEVGKAYRDIMGRHFPAMTMVVVSGLVEDRALLEIEATAVISQPNARR